MVIDNDLLSMQHARILAENAFAAQKSLAAFAQEQLDQIVEAVCEAIEPHAEQLAISSHGETDSGRWQDKLIKNRFVCTEVRKRLQGMRCVGVLGSDPVKKTREIGVPVGVIVALCPVTSPVSTTIYKTLLAIKSGNSILFAPHPRARKAIRQALDIMIDVAEAHGLPKGSLACLDPVSKSGARELMTHPAVSLVFATGVPGMLKLAQESGKTLIYGGTGNGPAFIERTADIDQAIRDIIVSKTFDLGLAPSAEQSLVVETCIAGEVREALRRNGAYFMTESECDRLADVLFCPLGSLRKGSIGQNVQVLARRAGFSIPETTTILIAERKFVSEVDPYFKEILSPVLGLYLEDDWLHACEKCIELLLHERNAHTMVIHSKDEAVIEQFAIKKPVGRMLVNTPGSLGGMGMTTNLFPAMTLGSRSAGQGITPDNVSPLNLIYTRQVGYGVHHEGKADDLVASGTAPAAGQMAAATITSSEHESKTARIQQILAEAIRALSDPDHEKVDR